jgi:membrane protein required for beta-lactamase induction
MNIDWPVAFIILALIAAVGGLGAEALKHRLNASERDVKAEYEERYRMLASDCTSLAKEMHEDQKAVRSDLADMRAKVESIERMMRDVG